MWCVESKGFQRGKVTSIVELFPQIDPIVNLVMLLSCGKIALKRLHYLTNSAKMRNTLHWLTKDTNSKKTRDTATLSRKQYSSYGMLNGSFDCKQHI